MLVTILTNDSQIHNIYVNPYMNLGALRNLCSVKSSLPTEQILLSLNGVVLENDDLKLIDCNIVDGSLLNMQRKKSKPAPLMDIDSLDFSNIRVPKQKRQKTVDTHSNAQNIELISNEMKKSLDEKKRMEDLIQNFETAVEQFPETFGQVCMLYINCKVNNHEVKAFVDSGAQMTIMSQAFAEKCDLMRLVDTRFAGVAKGVGVQEILGRVHLAQLQVGNIFLPCSFSILKNQQMDMLLGLDMLKRHQCMIDLMNNELVFGTTRTRAPFLSEGDLPTHARLNQNDAESCNKELESLRNSSNDSMEITQESTNVQQPSVDNTPTTSAQGQSNQISEDSIQLITDHGFSRDQAIAELKISGGLVDEALAALYTTLESLRNSSNDSMEITQESTNLQQPSVDNTPKTSAQGQSNQISEDRIQLITDHGFSRDQAIAELKISGGLVDEALAALYTTLYSN